MARDEGGGRVRVVVLEPMTRTGLMPDVCKMTAVVEGPAPRIRGVLADSVCPAST